MHDNSVQTLGLLLRPVDQLFFRDARPFGLRESGQSTLPTPQSLYGALKTHLMHTLGLKPSDLHGLHNSTANGASHHWMGKIKVRGPWLYRENAAATGVAGPLVAAPADLVQGKSDGSEIMRLRPLRAAPPHWQPVAAGLRPMWSNATEALRPVSGWLDNAMLSAYLRGETVTRTCRATELFRWHDRTGIGINFDRGVADDGAIYSTRNLALAPDICFYAELALPADAPDARQFFSSGLSLPWGGEGRRVAVESLNKPYAWPSAQPAEDRILSLLISPGIFSNHDHPWRPRERGSLISACVRPPTPVSGWDLAGANESNRQPGPKPTRFAVPAGAVYLWTSTKIAKHGPETPRSNLDNLSDRPRDTDAGWGIALTGTWKYFDDAGPHRG